MGLKESLEFIGHFVDKTHKHAFINAGKIYYSTESLTASAPFNCDFSVKVEIETLIAALSDIDQKNPPSFSMSKTGAFQIKNGKRRASIKTAEGDIPTLTVYGKSIAGDWSRFLSRLKIVSHLTSRDEKTFCRSVLLSNGSACASNNAVFVEATDVPPLTAVLDGEFCKRLSAIKLNLTHVLESDRSVTFRFDGDFVVTSAQLNIKWSTIDHFRNAEAIAFADFNQICEHSKSVSKFSDSGKVRVGKGVLFSHENGPITGEGLVVEIKSDVEESVYRIKDVLSVKGLFDKLGVTGKRFDLLIADDENLKGYIARQ